MKLVVVALAFLSLGAVGGVVLPRMLAPGPAGPDVQCVSGASQTICKGQTISALTWEFQRSLGGVVVLHCGYEQPGNTGNSGDRFGIPAMVSGCQEKRYVVTFSNGRTWSNFWVEDGRIARIDEYPAYERGP